MATVLPFSLLIGLLASAAVSAESFYDPATYRALASDHRAHRPGDLLTVLIFESATASTRANSTTSRKSKLEARVANLSSARGGSLSSDNEFDGGGIERRSGEVVARVSVRVLDVLENGELHVKGEQLIALNSESQRITVEGRVRQEDIGTDNTVVSSRLADAKISFKGRGLLSARQRPGIIVRFLHWLL